MQKCDKPRLEVKKKKRPNCVAKNAQKKNKSTKNSPPSLMVQVSNFILTLHGSWLACHVTV